MISDEFMPFRSILGHFRVMKVYREQVRLLIASRLSKALNPVSWLEYRRGREMRDWRQV